MNKKTLTFILLTLWSTLTFSQEFVEYSLTDLKSKVDQSIAGLITRDDEVSMELMNFYLNSDGGKYMIDITISYFKQEYLGNRTLIKSQNLILDQIIENKFDGVTNFDKGNYKEVFGPTNLENSNLIRVNIGVTKIDGKESLFTSFGELLDDVSPTTKTVNTIFKVMGINKDEYEQNQTRLISSSEINVPLNFVEYGLEENKERPYLINNETFGIPFQLTIDLDNPSNLKRLGTNVINKVSKWIYGGEPIAVDQENVVGGLTIKYTKDKNLSIPTDVVTILEDFSEDIQLGDYELSEALNRADELKSFIKQKLKDKYITKKMADNANFYVLLCKQYIQFGELNKGNLSQVDLNFFSGYDKWIKYAYNTSTAWGFRKFGISGFYDNYSTKIKKKKLNYERRAKMYLPYSLTNTLILHSISMQEEVHKYFASYINNDDNSELHSRMDNLIYENEI